jgi:hypothetical protein
MVPNKRTAGISISIVTVSKYLIVLATLLLLAGCTSSENRPLDTATPAQTTIVTGTLTTMQHNTVTPDIAPDSTPVSQVTLLAINTVVQQVTRTVDQKFIESCVQLETRFDQYPDGMAILKGVGANSGELLGWYSTNNRTVLFGQIRDFCGSDIGISPDLDRFAFIDIQDSALKIVDAEGFISTTIPVIKNWQAVIDWVNEDQLLIENMPLLSDRYDPPATSILFNLSVNTYEEYFPNYPGQAFIGAGSPNWHNYYFTQSIYDPTFTRVVYPAYDDIGGFLLVLHDLEHLSELAKFRSLYPNFGGQPRWTRDGSSFIASFEPLYVRRPGQIMENIVDDLPFLGGVDLMRINRDGDVERLTYFATSNVARVDGHSLSPDKLSIAFWLTMNDYPASVDSRQLAILNISSKEVSATCLISGDYPHPFVWSPDGKYLAATISDWMINQSDVIIIDIDNKEMVKIAEQALGIGWIR